MSMIGNYRRVEKQRLDALLSDLDGLAEFLYPESEEDPSRYLDIDKSWHLIHFLLNRETWEGEWPLSAVVFGGVELGEEDMGYGPARYLRPEEVGEVASALSAIPASDLLERWNSSAIAAAEIYPGFWAGGSDDREYIRSNYESLREFFRAAALSGEAMILYVS
ncbi:MAG: DUF1877 family protein [Acidobacteria bacterium]|nr:MAG: DUF1877 family protein [Acidobacteriota bacterium]REK08377.1 MAG: DUF1877 family protein [Acidobacteriota bacterium]